MEREISRLEIWITDVERLMRDINRIEPFMNEVAGIWKEKFPDWRFG